MNQHLLTEHIKSINKAIQDLTLALDKVQIALSIFAEKLPNPIEPNIPTVGIKATIKTHWDIANRIAKSTDTVLRTLNPGEYNFGYYYTKGRFIEVYRLLVTHIDGWIAKKEIDVELSKAVSHIMQTLGSEGHAWAFREYLATKKMPIPNANGIITLNGTDYVMDGAAIRTLTPKSIAEAIAAATNLELLVDSDEHYAGRDHYQIGYRTPVGKFMVGKFMPVTDFHHDDIAIKIATHSVGNWMKITVANIMEKTAGLKAVDDYRKRKAAKSASLIPSVNAMFQNQNRTLDNGEFSQ